MADLIPRLREVSGCRCSIYGGRLHAGHGYQTVVHVVVVVHDWLAQGGREVLRHILPQREGGGGKEKKILSKILNNILKFPKCFQYTLVI